jgi:hypothetical protein
MGGGGGGREGAGKQLCYDHLMSWGGGGRGGACSFRHFNLLFRLKRKAIEKSVIDFYERKAF